MGCQTPTLSHLTCLLLLSFLFCLAPQFIFKPRRWEEKVEWWQRVMKASKWTEKRTELYKQTQPGLQPEPTVSVNLINRQAFIFTCSRMNGLATKPYEWFGAYFQNIFHTHSFWKGEKIDQ